jgi:two-component system response regulator DevR
VPADSRAVQPNRLPVPDVVRGRRGPAARCARRYGLGFLLKQLCGVDIVDAIRTLASGGSVFTPRETSLVLAGLRGSRACDPLQSLTRKERQVLDLVAAGRSNREIGDRLQLAEKTVKNHVSSLLRKLGVQRRTQLVLLVERAEHARLAPVG